MKKNREDRIVLGRNFNGKIGGRGARNWEEERGEWEKKEQRQGGKCTGEEKKMDGGFRTGTRSLKL
jgi:hypothetical protein